MKLRRFYKPQEINPDDVRMTLGEHLEELRSRLLRSIVALAIGAVACYLFIDYVEGFLTTAMYAVLRRHNLPTEMNYFSVTEKFILDIKLAVIIGFIVMAPYILTQIWGFVAAGLYPQERRWVRRFVPVSITLFFTGALFFLVVVTPLMLDFFISYGESELPDMSGSMPAFLMPAPTPLATSQPAAEHWHSTDQPAVPAFLNDPPDAPEGRCWLNQTESEIRVRFGEKVYTLARLREVRGTNRIVPTLRIIDYILFVLGMATAFGLGFQVPVVVALLATLGIMDAAEMSRIRRYVWFGIAVGAALITPSPDVTSMMALFVPMVVLFEGGLIAARFIERERTAAST